MTAIGRSIAATAAATLLGAAYYQYLTAISYPADASRAVPFIWLAVGWIALRLGLTGLKSPATRWPSAAISLVAALNIAFAGIYCLGALMGD